MGLRERAVRGAFWSAVTKWGDRGLTFLVFFALVRLLNPEDFGLVAMATVLIEFMRVFIDQGMVESIIQMRNLDDEHLDSAFWLSIAMGMGFCVSGIALAGPIAFFFEDERLAPVIMAFCPVFLLVALTTTQEAILRRSLNLKALALRSLIARIVGGASGIAAALYGLGVWSLVVQNLVGAATAVVVLWTVSSWKPGFRFSVQKWKEMAKFGVNIIGVRLLNSVDLNIDNLLIGKFLGPVTLGYYTVAFRLIRMTITTLNGVTNDVLFPVFSRLQHDPEKLKEGVCSALKYLALFAFPVFLGLSVTAPEIVEGVFGREWAPSIVPMQILAIGGLVIAIISIYRSLLLAMGKPSWILCIRIFATFIRVFAFVIALRWGIKGVSMAFVISTFVFAPVYLGFTRKLLGLGYARFFKEIMHPAIAAFVMVFVVWATRFFSAGFVIPVCQLGIYTCVGAAAYLLTVAAIQPSLLSGLRQVFTNSFSSLNVNSKKRG